MNDDSDSIYCPMIHSGLNIDLRNVSSKLKYNQCCLSTTPMVDNNQNRIDWNSDYFKRIRQENLDQKWLPGCWECERLEKVGVKSFRQSMIQKLGTGTNPTGPKRIDLLFDRQCNLACRNCGEWGSSYWTKHLKDNGQSTVYDIRNFGLPKIKQYLSSLDLSDLRMIQFCGGETLLGNTYWQATEWLADNVPDAKENLELGFQTNGTQPIDPKWFDLIDRFKLVKLMISIDGIGDRFEYLRWPANWQQTVDNLQKLREQLPSNVMFFVQETTNCLNLYHFEEVGTWVRQNFNTNREGDPIDHSTQLVNHHYLHVDNITQEYFEWLQDKRQIKVLNKNWKENPSSIKTFIRETEKLDSFRSQDWKKTFPEVADFYRRYL